MAVTNVPIQLTSFVGRERELAEVQRLLATSRLVTLTGAGGCGKTRLAIQAAKTLSETFADGIWVVDLTPLREPALVPQLVAQTLGLALTLVIAGIVASRWRWAPLLAVLWCIVSVIPGSDAIGQFFDIDELNVHVPIPSGKPAIALFKPTTPGTYTFYCASPVTAKLAWSARWSSSRSSRGGN